MESLTAVLFLIMLECNLIVQIVEDLLPHCAIKNYVSKDILNHVQQETMFDTKVPLA
jgi:hypothetical protein